LSFGELLQPHGEFPLLLLYENSLSTWTVLSGERHPRRRRNRSLSTTTCGQEKLAVVEGDSFPVPTLRSYGRSSGPFSWMGAALDAGQPPRWEGPTVVLIQELTRARGLSSEVRTSGASQ